MCLCSLKLDSSKFAASEPLVFSTMAGTDSKMTASPLHVAAAEENEQPKESGSAMVPAGETQVPAPVDEALALEVAETKSPAEGAAAGVFQDPEKQKRIEFEKKQEELKEKILSDIHGTGKNGQGRWQSSRGPA